MRACLFSAVLCIGVGNSGCDAVTEATPPGSVRAEFGVLFGGQVQQRERIPLETDRSKQTLGFRLTFPHALAKSRRVEWQLDVPGTSRQAPDRRGRLGEGRIIRLGNARTRVGETQFEQVIDLLPADPPGTCNIRVILDGELVLDRPFLLFKAN